MPTHTDTGAIGFFAIDIYIIGVIGDHAADGLFASRLVPLIAYMDAGITWMSMSPRLVAVTVISLSTFSAATAIEAKHGSAAQAIN